MIDVIANLGKGERTEPSNRANPLPKLSQSGLFEFESQLWLSSKDYLKQLLAWRLKICEQASSFENILIQILRLIDNHDQTPARARLVDEQAVQLLVHPDEVLPASIDSEIVQYVLQKAGRVTLSLKQESCSRRLFQMFKQAEDKRRFPHPRRGYQCHQAAIHLYPVSHGSECLTVRRTEMKKPRIW
jgi:hypothetical protein